MKEAKADIRGLTLEEMKELLTSLGEKSFRGQQIFQWVQDKAVQNWTEMRNIGQETKTKLEQYAEFTPHKLLTERISHDGTRKFLWELKDGRNIESVLLHHTGDITKTRYTVCLSTQVGCPMGCGFCATGKLKFTRNLTAGEIAGQVLDITYHRRKVENDFKINNVVYMGMGEPLLNLAAVLKSIRILNHEQGQNIGIRRFTISTCGLVPQIRELAREKLDIVLAVSLHAPTNELRNQIMPVNQKYPLEELIKACREYIELTGRRITFEYALVKGFNDGLKEVHALVKLLRGLEANVNIIPVNTTDNNVYQRPALTEVYRFVKALEDNGIKAVIREEKGSDIQAACGQLAGTYPVNVAPR
ncbi:MAG: 23S rRNA (adenine(2503)-C(2))-methyltransferase RlmN [Bacillota bacterium]|uniref:Probable dual-specificity RNA methyltransferase RlmN n=1 Tax=Thermanaerosceptrum fracticalcis TaxID=1712410 RepID=A0A7G6E1N5_THEFR|nr:23S rRNA (adenine(2503)-C(2))-methyltransferase RlmN [Thermanaerosceptrum fracticalcis]QNB45989.1 23S rRNA (adenine(2503)-C(2))-methyltransferase RlmN [Thermanaerosceptrum fracticalcis]